MMINLKHKNTNVVKQVKIGFSWTVLFFGVFVPLFRGDCKWFLIMILCSLITFEIAWITFAFI